MKKLRLGLFLAMSLSLPVTQLGTGLVSMGGITASVQSNKLFSMTIISTSTPPVVSVTTPINGSSVSGVTPLTVVTSDIVKVTKVEVYIDGILHYYSSPNAVSPYVFNWKTQYYSVGSHTIFSKAYDIAGNVGVSGSVSAIVIDSIAPKVSISSPGNGSTVSGTTPLTVIASDNVGVVKVEVYIDGVLHYYSSLSAISPYIFNWKTIYYMNGQHKIMIKAYDVAGNVGMSTLIIATVLN